MNREGFALITVLWLVTALAALSLAGTLAARDAATAAGNRIAHTRALWRAEGCAQRVLARLHHPPEPDGAWERIPRWLPLDDFPHRGCAVGLAPAGNALDVNAAEHEQLARVLEGLGAPPAAADSVAAAILDWRDPDDLPRPTGAEASWYRSRGLSLPRNGPIAAAGELAMIRGVSGLPLGDTSLGVEPGRVPINLAPLAVVGALPGIGPELLARIRDRRRRGDYYRDLGELAYGISRHGRDSLLARYADLVEVATIQPEAWLLMVSAEEGHPRVTARLELRLVSAGGRIVVGRRVPQ